jgi:hypothetical protein
MDTAVCCLSVAVRRSGRGLDAVAGASLPSSAVLTVIPVLAPPSYKRSGMETPTSAEI